MNPSFNPNSKKGIDKAGNYISKRARNKIQYSTENDAAAFNAMHLWRMRHKGPLNSIRQQINKVLKQLGISKTVIVATRLKRSTSILNKLLRNESMELAQMQDIAGARVILKNKKQVDDFYRLFATVRKINPLSSSYIIKKEYDYVSQPKSDGYRSYHIVCAYQSKAQKSTASGLLVEVQIRTRYQHIWATAVEVMGLYQGIHLKSGEGDESILEFFRLCSAVISLLEKTPLHHDYAKMSEDEIKTRLVRLEKKTGILAALESFNAIDNAVENNLSKANIGKKIGCYLFIFNKESNKLRVRPFLNSEFYKASELYKNYEEQIRMGAPLDVVLITTSDRKKLKKAYPNYFADTRVFCYLIRMFAFPK